MKQKQDDLSSDRNEPLLYKHNGELTSESLKQLILLHKQGYIKGGYSLMIYGGNQFHPADTFAEIEEFSYSADNKTLLLNVWMYGHLSILKIVSQRGFKVYNESFEIEVSF